MGNVNMEASQINYRGGEKKMSVEEALKNTSGEAAAIAQLQADVSNLTSTKANQITIAPFFSAEASYEVGDLVYYNGLSYRCTNAHEGDWDADDFAATTISGELDSLKSGLNKQYTITAAENVNFIHESISVNNKNVNMSLIAILNCTAGVWTNIGTISKRPNDNAIATCARSGDGTYLGMVEIIPSGIIHMYPIQTISTNNDGVGFSIAYCTND